jgi:hypothetical protein
LYRLPHVALLTPELRLGLGDQAKALDLNGRVRCRGWARRKGRLFRSSDGARAGEPARACRLKSRAAISNSNVGGAENRGSGGDEDSGITHFKAVPDRRYVAFGC